MATLFWILVVFVLLIGSHGFAYWRGAVAGEALARQQMQRLGDAIRNWIDRLKGRLGL